LWNTLCSNSLNLWLFHSLVSMYTTYHSSPMIPYQKKKIIRIKLRKVWQKIEKRTRASQDFKWCHQINTNECLPFESEEEESVGSESDTATTELKGLSVTNWSEVVLPQMMVVIRWSSIRVRSRRWHWESECERKGREMKNRENLLLFC